VDALEGPIVQAATASPSSPALHNGSTATRVVAKAGSISPAILSVIYAAVGPVALLGVILLWCLRRRCRRLSEQRRKAEKAQQETRAVLLQARARALLAKRKLLQARAAKVAREAAATRVQIRLRKKLKLREIKREFKARIEAFRLEQRLEQAATTLQRQVRTGLSPAVRRRNAEAMRIEIRSLAASIIQRQLRPVLVMRRSLLDSLYRRARANWLKMSRRLGRRHEFAFRWRTLADAVLDAQVPSDNPLLEAANVAWQVVWKFIGSPAALKVAPVTISAAQKQLLCRRRLDFLSGRPQPAQPQQAPETLEGEPSHPPLTQNGAQSLRSLRSPESSESFGRSCDSSPDLSPDVRTRPQTRKLGSAAKQIVDGFGGAERRVKAAEVVAVEAFAAAAVGTAVDGTTATKAAAAAGSAADDDAVAWGGGLLTLLRLHAHTRCSGAARRALGTLLDYLLHLTPSTDFYRAPDLQPPPSVGSSVVAAATSGAGGAISRGRSAHNISRGRTAHNVALLKAMGSDALDEIDELDALDWTTPRALHKVGGAPLNQIDECLQVRQLLPSASLSATECH
jgi:hypothetical protein